MSAANPSLPRLLIIDDQPDSVALLLAYLERTETDIRVALNGEDGLARARDARPDLILLDVVMPGLDGFAVCRQLKADPRLAPTPVIFLSASPAVEDKLKGFEAGAVDYITKPFAEQEVLARVLVHLQAKQRLDLLESMARRRVLEGVESPGEREERIFSKAVAFLEDHLSDPPGLQALARQMGCNERKLTDLFRHQVGMTVFDYVSELRMETARRLIEGSALQVQLIAERVGYRNAGDFTRAFRRRYGVTPREYRVAKGGVGEPDAD